MRIVPKSALGIPHSSCGQGRIRTSEGVSRQIYSLMRLTASLPTQLLATCDPLPPEMPSSDFKLSFGLYDYLLTVFELATRLELVTC